MNACGQDILYAVSRHLAELPHAGTACNESSNVMQQLFKHSMNATKIPFQAAG